MRGSQLARQWKIIKLMESRKRGISAADISNELEAPVRTIYRDLESIQEAGFPVFNERIDGQSLWKFVDGFKAGYSIPLTITKIMFIC
jgi:predicted DNA-binding transcriptional regulator YafY